MSAVTILECERFEMTTEGFLPVIIARCGDVVMRVPLDKSRSLILATGINAKAKRISKMTSLPKRGRR